MPIMMLSREIRQVPSNFSWPLQKVWDGYIMPDHLVLPDCYVCSATGYSKAAKKLSDTFYPHQCKNRADAWMDKLTKQDAEHLVSEGRWNKEDVEKFTIDEINAMQRDPKSMSGPFYVDAINRYLLVMGRVSRMELDLHCELCNGKGDLGTDAQRKAYDEWEPTDPPLGPSIQMWETVSEGSPISPVFSNTVSGKKKMAKWLSENSSVCGDKRSEKEWMLIIEDEVLAFDIHTNELC